MTLIPEDTVQNIVRYCVAQIASESRLPELVADLEYCFGNQYRLNRSQVKMLMSNKHSIYGKVPESVAIQAALARADLTAEVSLSHLLTLLNLDGLN